MERCRLGVGLLTLVAAAGLAACSQAAPKSTAGSASSTSAPAVAASTSGGRFCTEWKDVEAGDAALASSFGAAATTDNLTAVRGAFASYFSRVSGDLTSERSDPGATPQDIQDAIGTVAGFLTQMQTKVAGATTMGQITSAYTALQGSPQLQSASTLLSAYVGSHCGTGTPATAKG